MLSNRNKSKHYEDSIIHTIYVEFYPPSRTVLQDHHDITNRIVNAFWALANNDEHSNGKSRST